MSARTQKAYRQLRTVLLAIAAPLCLILPALVVVVEAVEESNPAMEVPWVEVRIPLLCCAPTSRPAS
jgi:hypothetical protein